MPTKREREYYQLGFRDGYQAKSEERRRTSRVRSEKLGIPVGGYFGEPVYQTPSGGLTTATKPRTRRKLSAWNKFVKANSKKPRFIMRSGKLNLKKMGVAFRKTKR